MIYFLRLTAIFDSCHSGTVLDLPFIYDLDGKPKQQKYSETKSSEADIILFSGCKDSQTSKEKSGKGVASSAFINTVKNGGGNLTYVELLSIMRDESSGYDQIVQMSTGYPMDMNIPFHF